MQYLYDDVIPPFRFFTKIVLKCVNDALDKAAASCRPNQGTMYAPYTTIAQDNPILVEIPTGLVMHVAVTLPRRRSSEERTNPPARSILSAVFLGYDVTLCGFTDGRVALMYSGQEGGAVEKIEIPPLKRNFIDVVALNCVPLSEGKWAVAIGYKGFVFVRKVELRRSAHLPILLRKRAQPRVIEMCTTEWYPNGSLSSLQLSPCLKYIAVGFDNDALVAVAALPSLDVFPHELGEGSERVTMDVTCRLVEDGRLNGIHQGRVFFMPERLPGGMRSVFSAGMNLSDMEVAMGAHYPLCLFVWVNGNSYTRCPLKSISRSAVTRLNSFLHPMSSTGEYPAAKSLDDAAATASGAAASAAYKLRRKSRLGVKDSKRRSLNVSHVAATAVATQSPFTGVYRGVLSDRIVAAASASADGTVVAVGCAGGCVYLMNGHGITSMFFATVFEKKAMRLNSLYPSTGLKCGMVLQAVNTSKNAEASVTLAHARGIPSAAFINRATVHCLREVEGLQAVLPLRELPCVLLFCTHGMYLWDVHYNSVVASLTGLPPLVSISLCETVERRSSINVQRHGSSIKTRQELRPPFCTESAIMWWTSSNTLARLLISDLLGQVYPLLETYFRDLPMRSLAYLLARIPPTQRHIPEYMATVEVPTEQQLMMDGYDINTPAAFAGAGGSRGSFPGMKAFMNAAAPSRFFELSCTPLHPETLAACFLETTFSSASARSEELLLMLGFPLSRGS
ncbi:hypothetical protein MOQ_001800 [Trypanosoma cruzi marinkellei]|uniref:Uncharacterized protein n=1 Tax=Trypanosoma cruzi marinkellei TaxID=85056 RepID=K2PA93_TRYCR|nr:hypothetical protein MOQ_001800 [Trypanosoma cruzi marinkellei]